MYTVFVKGNLSISYYVSFVLFNCFFVVFFFCCCLFFLLSFCFIYNDLSFGTLSLIILVHFVSTL